MVSYTSQGFQHAMNATMHHAVLDAYYQTTFDQTMTILHTQAPTAMEGWDIALPTTFPSFTAPTPSPLPIDPELTPHFGQPTISHQSPDGPSVSNPEDENLAADLDDEETSPTGPPAEDVPP